MDTILHHGGNGALPATDPIRLEGRLTSLEMSRDDHGRRLDRLESQHREVLQDGHKRDLLFRKLHTHFQLVAEAFQRLEAEHRRFLIGAALGFGGVLVQIIRAKIGV